MGYFVRKKEKKKKIRHVLNNVELALKFTVDFPSLNISPLKEVQWWSTVLSCCKIKLKTPVKA